jgi:hypothetical protein
MEQLRAKMRGVLGESIALAATRVAQAKPRGLADWELHALARGLVPFLHEFVAEAQAPLTARIAELEQQLAECLKEGGTDDPEAIYDPKI